MLFWSLINTGLFVAVGGLHLYWALRPGPVVQSPVVPTDGNSPVFVPGRLMTLGVAGGLFTFALISISAYTAVLPPALTYWGTVAIAFIFLLRSVGDFRYVGFTKRVRNTTFARYDTRYYSPLCVLIGLVAVRIVLLLGESA